MFRAPKHALGATFVPHPPPTRNEVDALAKTLARRVTNPVTRFSNIAPDDALLERGAAQPAQRDGFQVHAATAVPPNSPAQLERLLRYVGRPALQRGRIERRVDGTVVFKLGRPRRGVTSFLFQPVAFLARIPALVQCRIK